MNKSASIIRYPLTGTPDLSCENAASCQASDATGEADSGYSSIWNMQRAMEYLEELDSDEAVEYLAKAILCWNESDCEIPPAIEQFIIKQSGNAFGQDLPLNNKDQLSQYRPTRIDQRLTRSDRSDADVDVIPDTKPESPTAEEREHSGLLAAMKFAHMLDTIERSRI